MTVSPGSGRLPGMFGNPGRDRSLLQEPRHAKCSVFDEGMCPPLLHVLQVISQVIHFHATPLTPPGLCDASVEPVACLTIPEAHPSHPAGVWLGLRLGECWSAGCNMLRLEVRAEYPPVAAQRLSALFDGWMTE